MTKRIQLSKEQELLSVCPTPCTLLLSLATSWKSTDFVLHAYYSAKLPARFPPSFTQSKSSIGGAEFFLFVCFKELLPSKKNKLIFYWKLFLGFVADKGTEGEKKLYMLKLKSRKYKERKQPTLQSTPAKNLLHACCELLCHGELPAAAGKARMLPACLSPWVTSQCPPTTTPRKWPRLIPVILWHQVSAEQSHSMVYQSDFISVAALLLGTTKRQSMRNTNYLTRASNELICTSRPLKLKYFC